MIGPNDKVTPSHLKRDAYLYVRQSTLRQVVENTESTQRQYALRQRALALGWHAEQIVVIDTDLGHSAAHSQDREGFQELVGAVGMARAGIVLGLEVSRLARNSTDWHRLLEICAVTDTLILDEDGIYDPAHFNDRLLLGLKGTMSEAELHVLRARLRGGILNKARRGELRMGLPIGYAYDPIGRVTLDPDAQVQASVRLLFDTFARTQTACSVVKYFNENGVLFPTRVTHGPCKGEVAWGALGLTRAVTILHNPRYTGAYVYGQRRIQTLPGGRSKTKVKPRDEWLVHLPNAHPAYVSWDDHERIQERLRDSARAYGLNDRHGPPREGPALLQGLVICGRCGARMSVRYHQRRGSLIPEYACMLRCVAFRESACQIVQGGPLDAAIGQLLVERMTPLAIDLCLAVHDELRSRVDQADRLRRQQVERAQYESDLARSRYMQVDPSNRLVADSLEADWNEKLRRVAHAREECERARKAEEADLDERQRQRVQALADDFPALWADPNTAARERKRLMALLVEDVTLIKADKKLTAQVRLRGGQTATLILPALTFNEGRVTPPTVLAQVETLLDEHTDEEVVAILNERGLKTGAGAPFTLVSLRWIKQANKLDNHPTRQRKAGLLTTRDVATQLGVSDAVVRQMRTGGLLVAKACNGLGTWLYEPLEKQPRLDAVHARIRRSAAARSAADTRIARGAV